MPILKPISGHTGTARIEAYLEKGGRALARDFYNLSWDENEMAGYDERLKQDVRWSGEMDRLRARCGNDKPFGDKRARTFVHYVLSPTPEDNMNLEQLRELARAWVQRYLPEYQVAIVYHDDNAGEFMHAHIVVNNTNVNTGYRIQIPNPLELNRGLQDMAEERGFGFLRNDAPDAPDGFAALASKGEEHSAPVRTRQESYLGRAERRVLESGEYSWMNDIRDRVSMAKTLARNESEFFQILDLLDVDVRANSPKARRDDWVYSLREQSTRCVGGERLGYSFGKEALQARFSRTNVARPSIESSKELMRLALAATDINDLAELHALATTVETNARFGIASIEDYDRRISTMQMKLLDQHDPRQRRNTEQSLAALHKACEFAQEKNLLPQHRPQPPKNKPTRAQRAAAAARNAGSATSASERSFVQQHEQTSRANRNR